MTQRYMSYQGKILIADSLDTGKPGRARWPLNSPEFTLSPSSTTKDHYESFSSLRQLDDQFDTVVKCDFVLTLDDGSRENFALAARATKTLMTSGSVSGEPLPAAVVVGDYVVLNKRVSGSLVLTDSAGSPATLVLNTDYRVSSFNPNVIEFLNVAGYTQPFEAAYTSLAGTKLALLNTQPLVKYLIGDLLNTRTQQPELVRIYKAKFDLAKAMAFINGDYNSLALTGTCLASLVNGIDSTLGYFGSIEGASDS